MVPPKTHPRYRELVTGKLTHSFAAVSAGMCVSRSSRQVEKQGKSPAAVDSAVDEIHAFFTKYEKILAADLAAIFG